MHLFAGAGGGLLADLILGHEPVIAVEWEPYACQILRERAADGWFPNLSVYEGDVRLFDPSEYAGRVDCIHAGFPCQDISLAGNQAGVGPETRSGLYREVIRIAGVVRPRYLFLENVSAIVTNGLNTVLSDLIALGYESEWLCLRASDCGAKHHRDRWWLLANSNELGRRQTKKPEQKRKDKTEPRDDGKAEHVSDTKGTRARGNLARVRGLPERCGIREKRMGQDVAYTMCLGRERQGKSIESISAEKAGDRKTSNAVNECFGDFWEVEPGVGRVVDGMASRVDRIKALGNGQVSLQAAVAWRLLGGE